MKDRVPEKPGRVLVTPENGGAAYYATLTRADNPTQEGTPLNKANLLTDETAALFGFGSNATPNEVFGWLGKYNQHWWRRRSFPSVDDVVVGDIVTTPTDDGDFKASDLYGSAVGDPGNNTKEFTVQYSGELFVDGNGELQLYSPTIKSTTYSDITSDIPIADLRGKYYKSTLGDGQIWYASPTAAYKRSSYCCWLTEVARVSFPFVPGEWEYLVSTDRNAYPESGVENGNEYEYLGVPFENVLTAPKIATGNYTGTGTYGANKPNSLAFDFEPKLVFVGEVGGSAQARMINGTASGDIRRGTIINYSMTLTWNENTVSWYGGDNSSNQLNSAGTTYNYVAIG